MVLENKNKEYYRGLSDRELKQLLAESRAEAWKIEATLAMRRAEALARQMHNKP